MRLKTVLITIRKYRIICLDYNVYTQLTDYLDFEFDFKNQANE